MKKIIKYSAIDDVIFDTKNECIVYESQLALFTNLVNQLEDIDRDCDFSNGDGYIQQESKTVIRLRQEMMVYAKACGLICPRELHDSQIGGLHSLYYRLSCVDENWREWGQKYYAINPSEGIGTCMNPTEELR